MEVILHMAVAALGLSRAEEHNFAFIASLCCQVSGSRVAMFSPEIWVQASNVRARRIALRALRVTGHHSSQDGIPVKGAASGTRHLEAIHTCLEIRQVRVPSDASGFT
jgi:hypothetical protein